MLKMKKRISLFLIVVLMLSAIAMTGCGGSEAKEPENTGEITKATEGELTVYTALEDEQVTQYLADFNAKYPDIKVNIVRESTGIITAKLLAEKDNPQADVVWGTAASSMLVLDDLGALVGYTPEGIERILPQFKSDKAEPTWVGIDAWETAIVVNTVEAAKLGLPPIKS